MYLTAYSVRQKNSGLKFHDARLLRHTENKNKLKRCKRFLFLVFHMPLLLYYLLTKMCREEMENANTNGLQGEEDTQGHGSGEEGDLMETNGDQGKEVDPTSSCAARLQLILRN
jgi:hypothetical protein